MSEEMITLKWTEDAIREIVLEIWPYEDPDNAENKKWIDSKVKELIPIILKHCPGDKAVGKLVEALKMIEKEAARAPNCDWMTLSGVAVWIGAYAKAALADYEEAKKRQNPK